MAMRKIIIALIIFIVLLIAIFTSAYIIRISNYKKAVRGISITEVDLSSIGDGIYIGEFDADIIYAKVEVHIKDSEIQDIKLIEHKNDRGKAAEKIIEDIKSEQKINIDSISGATNSSMVIKKAIENALTQ